MLKESIQNIKAIEKLFGIEAARNAIIKEIQDVMDMQKLYVDIRHIMLIADAMTYAGEIKIYWKTRFIW